MCLAQNDYVQESAVPLELETHGGEDVSISCIYIYIHFTFNIFH